MNYTAFCILLVVGVLAVLALQRRVRVKNGEFRFLGICHFKAESLEVDADEPERISEKTK